MPAQTDRMPVQTECLFGVPTVGSNDDQGRDQLLQQAGKQDLAPSPRPCTPPTAQDLFTVAKIYGGINRQLKRVFQR